MSAHKRHGDVHDHPMGIQDMWCCVYAQLKGVGWNDCDECGERWPCPDAKGHV